MFRLLTISCLLQACTAPWAVRPAEAEVAHRVQSIVADIAAERGRDLRVPPIEVATQPELRAIAAGQLPDDLEDWRHDLVALGVIDGDTDPAATMLDRMGPNIGGMYSPDDERVFISSADAQHDVKFIETLRHELTHALQDQHFGLRARPGLPSDLQTVYKMQVEGGATYTELAIQLGAGVVDASTPTDVGLRRSAQLQGTPFERYIINSTGRSYVDGFTAVQLLRLSGGWPAVDAAWADLPLSTEQLLEDPSDRPRYLRRDGGEALARGRVGPADTLGQHAMTSLLSAVLPTDVVATGRVDNVMRGWDGDRYQTLLHPDGRHGFVWRTVWDSTAEAEAFAELLRPWRPGDQPLTVEIRGDEVLLLSGIPVDALQATGDFAWRGRFVEVASLEALLALHDGKGLP